MKKGLLGIIIALLIVGSIYFGYQTITEEKYNYAIININPQIELALNKRYEVVKVIGLNEDAEIVLEGLNLKGLTLEDATKLVIEEAIKTGYIDEFASSNYIRVMGCADEEEINQIMEEKIINTTKTVLDEKEIYYSAVAIKIGDSLKEVADEKKISYGKMLLVELAHSLDNSLDKGKLMTLSNEKIQHKIDSYIENRRLEKDMNQEQYQNDIRIKKQGKIKENNKRIDEMKDKDENKESTNKIDKKELNKNL